MRRRSAARTGCIFWRYVRDDCSIPLESDDRVTVECVDELPIFWRRIGSAFVYSSPVFALVIPRRGPGNCCLCEVSRTIAGALTPASPGNFSPAPSVGRCSRTSKLQKRTCSRVIGATDRYLACRSVESIHCCSLYAKLRKLLNQDKKTLTRRRERLQASSCPWLFCNP